MGIFGKKPSKIHGTKAGRAFDDAVRELDRNRKQDELAKRRQQKNGGGRSK